MPDRSHCRQPEPLDGVLLRAKAKNAQLAAQGEPPVIDEEVLAARLYTGPLFVKYNAVLRGLHSTSPFLRNSLVQLCCAPDVVRRYMGGARTHEEAKGGLPWASALAQCNKYVTTLHAINSCIVKTGKLTKCSKVHMHTCAHTYRDHVDMLHTHTHTHTHTHARTHARTHMNTYVHHAVSKVYRGMAGMALPDEFWHENEFGVRGGVENAFMSTTLDAQVAMGYASGSDRAGLCLKCKWG